MNQIKDMSDLANAALARSQKSKNTTAQYLVGGFCLAVVLCLAVVIVLIMVVTGKTRQVPDPIVWLATRTPTTTYITTITLAPTLAPVSQPTLTPYATITSTTQASQPGEPQGKIAFVCQIFKDMSRDQICLMDADGSGWQRMTTSDYGSYRYPAVAPEGQSIIFSGNADHTQPYQIIEMDLNGNSTILTQCPDGCLNPAISPDGLYIAFISADDALMVMNRDGSNPHAVIGPPTARAWDPAWSPDSQQIMFTSDKLATSYQLFRINLDGANLVQISDIPGIRGRSDWARNGNLIATYAGDAWKHNIFVMQADGTNVRQITNGGDCLAPSFSPDGQWIVFTGYIDLYGDDLGCEIYTMKIDGSNVKRLTKNDYCDWQPRWGP